MNRLGTKYYFALRIVFHVSCQVTELSRPSSIEVEDIIHQLVQNILSRFFVDDASSNFMEEGNIGNPPENGDEFSDTVGTSRDYLAKLLFWLVDHYISFFNDALQIFFA